MSSGISVSEPLNGVIRSDFDQDFFKVSAVRQVSSVEKFDAPPFKILYFLCEDTDTEGHPVMKPKDSFFGKGFYFAQDPMFIFNHDLIISTDKPRYMLRCFVDIGTFVKLPFAVYSQSPSEDPMDRKVDTVIGFLGGHNNYVVKDKYRISIEQVIAFRFTGTTVPREESYLRVPDNFSGSFVLISFKLQTWLNKLMFIAEAVDLYKTVSVIETTELGSRLVEVSPTSLVKGFTLALIRRKISAEKFLSEVEALIECPPSPNLLKSLTAELRRCGKDLVIFKNGKLTEKRSLMKENEEEGEEGEEEEKMAKRVKLSE